MPTRTPFRPVTIVVAVASVGAIAFLTLNPGWIVGPLRGAFVGRLFAATGGLGFDVDLEQAMNLAMFVPFGAAIAAVVPWRWGLVGGIAGFVVSAGVEVLQGAIPGRVSDPADVVWNTAGAAMGALVVFVVRASAAGVRAAVRSARRA